MSARPDISYAAVEAFERSKTPAKERVPSRLFTAVLLAVFFIVLMVGLIVGASMYRSAARAQMETDTLRMGTGLLPSYVRANDRADAVGVGEGPEGRSLVLTETHGKEAYEVRIYQYEGKVVQEYSVAGTAYTPARAQTLVESTTFDFRVSGKLLTITTDQGTIDVALRSTRGGTS